MDLGDVNIEGKAIYYQVNRATGRTVSAVSTDGGLRWSTAITGTTQINPQAPGATFLGFEDSRTGRWISDARHIWTTRDGGRHWLQRAFP